MTSALSSNGRNGSSLRSMNRDRLTSSVFKKSALRATIAKTYPSQYRQCPPNMGLAVMAPSGAKCSVRNSTYAFRAGMLLLLSVERRAYGSGQFGRGTFAPVVEEHVAGLFVRHVIVNGHDVNAVLAEGLQH